MVELIVLAAVFVAILVILALSHRNTVQALLGQNRELLKSIHALSSSPSAQALARQMELGDAQADRSVGPPAAYGIQRRVYPDAGSV